MAAGLRDDLDVRVTDSAAPCPSEQRETALEPLTRALEQAGPPHGS